MHGDTTRAPRPAAVHTNVWRGATPLFPPLTEEVRHILSQLPEVLARVCPLSAAHRRSLPDDVARLILRALQADERKIAALLAAPVPSVVRAPPTTAPSSRA